MSRILGIDLGTTNSCVSIFEAGSPVIIPSPEGERLIPSVVAYLENEGRIVGSVAKRQMVANTGSTIFSAKRFIGRKFDEVSSEIRTVPYSVISGPNEAVKFKIGEREIAPEEIGGLIIRELVRHATDYLKEEVTKAVITVPAYFTDTQRQATKNAGEIAGVEVVRIINEPTAAALAYGVANRDRKRIAVFDLGGGTFDVSILDVQEHVCEVLATAGDTHLGGDDFDYCLIQWLADRFEEVHKLELRNDLKALQLLSQSAERAKCELSMVQQVSVDLPFLMGEGVNAKHLSTGISRSKFEELISDHLERCRIPMTQAFEDAGVKPQDLDEVLLVGGSTRIPAFRKLVEEFTGHSHFRTSINPDEAVAMGAAVQGAVLSGQLDDMILLDVSPLSLGIRTAGGNLTKIIERNTAVPFRETRTFTTVTDNQRAVDIIVLQGEHPRAKRNRELGRFSLEGIRKSAVGVPQIEVTFDVDESGILNVSAVDTDTGKKQIITIHNSTTLSEKEIAQMTRDAERYAQDEAERQELVGAIAGVELLVEQVEDALSKVGEQVSKTCKNKCKKISEKVRRNMSSKGSIVKIRKLHEELESASQELFQVLSALEPSESDKDSLSEL